MSGLLQTPAGLAVLSLGNLALAAVAFALAWSEWRREREFALLCAATAFGLVGLQELATLGVGLLFVKGLALPPGWQPLRSALESLAGIALGSGLAAGAAGPNRWFGRAVTASVLLLFVLGAAWAVALERGSLVVSTDWYRLALAWLAAAWLTVGAVLVWRAEVHSRLAFTGGLGALALCAALGGHAASLPAEGPLAAVGAVRALLPTAGLALLVYAIYAKVVAELEYRAAERTALFRELADTQGQTVAGSVAAGVAHDMNGPLTVLATEGALALRAADAEEREGRLRRMSDQVWRLAHLTRNLLDFAAGSRTLRGPAGSLRRPADLREVLSDALTLLAYEIRHSRVTVTVEEVGATGQSPLPPVAVERTRLEQALVNLVRRAVRVSAEGASVTVRLRREPEAVLVEIEDEGPRLSEAELQRLACPGWMADGPLWLELGPALPEQVALLVSRDVIQQHGGSLTFRSAPSGREAAGTVCDVRLPVPPSTAAETPKPHSPP